MSDHPIHFGMDAEYASMSRSQESIGRRLIHDFAHELEAGEAGGRVLDLGCGPGHLTAEIARLLTRLRFEVSGADVDREMVALATRSHPGIDFDVIDIFEPFEGGYCGIFSNEVFHWTSPPPAQLSSGAVINPLLSTSPVQEDYSAWARPRLERALRHLVGALGSGGFALLQFGTRGQLRELYRLLDEVCRDRLDEYMDRIHIPVFYPDREWLKTVVESLEGAECRVSFVDEDLTELDADQIVQFVAGFTRPFFSRLLKEHRVRELFDSLRRKMTDANVRRIRRRAWRRAIVEIRSL